MPVFTPSPQSPPPFLFKSHLQYTSLHEYIYIYVYVCVFLHVAFTVKTGIVILLLGGGADVALPVKTGIVIPLNSC